MSDDAEPMLEATAVESVGHLRDDERQLVRTTITTALAKLACGMSFEDLDALIAAVEPLVMSQTSTGMAGAPLVRQSWRELYEREHEQRVRSDRWATIVADLDRCEHGRHEGDVCSECGGPSKGNPLWQAGDDTMGYRLSERFGGWASWPDRLAGFSLDGVPICVPPRVLGEAREPAAYMRRDLR